MVGRQATAQNGLQQPLFVLLLAGDAMPRPGHRFQPFLLDFTLAVGAQAEIRGSGALQRPID